MDFDKINVKNMYRYSEANVFSKIALHLLKQGKRSSNTRPKQGEVAGCLYRSKCGTKACAAGSLLTDDTYVPQLEGSDWHAYSKELACRGFRSAKLHSNVIRDMQYLHDEVHPVSWRQKLRSYAEQKCYKLRPEVREALGM